MDKKKWILEQHSSTNHMYDTYLPYEFHLRMVHNLGQQFKHLLVDDEYFTVDIIVNPTTQVSTSHACTLACLCHHVRALTRVVSTAVKAQFGPEPSDHH